MSCCGGRRSGHVGGIPPSPPGGGSRAGGGGGTVPAGPRPGSALPRTFHAFFRYEGRSGMTVVGGATGQRYRFGHPGAVVQVDPRDRVSLLRVPGLTQVAPG
jgi:hypothetical protein